MSSQLGNKFKVNIFGESHGKCIGVVIEGIPAGFEIDLDKLNLFMQKRKGKKNISTARNESDEVNIVSGFFNAKATGTPLTAIIKNSDVKSKDYEQLKNIFRPSHADYTGYVKYNGFNDYRGGGHFSGRLTAPLCVAGNIAMQILKKNYCIEIFSHIINIGCLDMGEKSFYSATYEEIKSINNKSLAFIDENAMNIAIEEIEKVKKNGDSVGGVIETGIFGIKTGIGEPIFDTIEGNIAKAIFAVPAVKGIDFGAGFSAGYMKGSEYNDRLNYVNDDEKNLKIETKTNHDGGINGGISNGMPIIFNTAVKPTPSIYIPQETINISTGKNTTLQIKGRHDPAIVTRAVYPVMSAAEIALLDLIL